MKIVVVVGGGKIATFEGEDLKVDNTSSNLLVVRDIKTGKQLGVFRSWYYWREVTDIGSTKKKTELIYGDTDKLAIINKKGTCVASLFILPDGNLAEDSWIRHIATVEKMEEQMLDDQRHERGEEENKDEETYTGWEADTSQILSIAESLKKMTDRKKALKALTKARKVFEELEKKYG